MRESLVGEDKGVHVVAVVGGELVALRGARAAEDAVPLLDDAVEFLLVLAAAFLHGEFGFRHHARMHLAQVFHGGFPVHNEVGNNLEVRQGRNV